MIPSSAIPPYDAILLVSPKRANDKAFLDALRPLIDADQMSMTMREANRRASEGASPEAVARWLAEKMSLKGGAGTQLLIACMVRGHSGPNHPFLSGRSS